MDVVKFFKDQVKIWNDDKKCGFCWEFDAPLTDAGINESEMQSNPDECCPVKVFITNLTERKNRTYNQSQLLTSYSIDYTFTLHLLKFDRTDTNVYSEQLGHPISESKWSTILRPLQSCICEDTLLKFCEIINKHITIQGWNAITRINWLDNNYTGWSITMTLRDYDCNDIDDTTDCGCN